MSLDEQVEELFPLGGPYNSDTTAAAARSIAVLVRYLNHATFHQEATPYPSTIHAVVRSLAGAVFGLDQLLRQLGQQLDGQDDRFGDRMYCDDGGDASDVVSTVLIHLGNARDHLGEAAWQLQEAASRSSHLGVREEQ